MEKPAMKNYLRFMLIVLLFTAAACSKNFSYTFEVPKEAIQQKLSEKFPMQPGSQEKEQSPLEMTISEPVVLLEEGKNQIGLKVNIVAIPTAPVKPAVAFQGPPKPGIPAPQLPGPGGKQPPAPPAPPKIALPSPPKPRFTGTATIFATVSYNANEKALHLSNPKITSLQIAQLPPPLSEPLSNMAEKALAEKFAQQPIPLEKKTEIDQAINTFLKSVTVKNGKMLVEIGW